MAMLDAFFNKGFKGTKCKTMLKLTIPRIKLLRNRREIQLKQMRKDIAKLIESGQEATARIRVEHIIREENMMAAQEILELFCELISVRLPIIETQRECPLDLKEAISSICFAAPRCADLPELQQVQMLFAVKYGKEFVAAATELMPDCGVNRQIIELLSIRAPSVEAKMKLLKEIAEAHGLDWDPSTSEAELLKPYEDLLNGPNHFTNGSTLPLPVEKHDNSSSTSHVNESNVESDSDAELDSLDLPEVPRESIRASSDVPSAPGISPHVSPFQPHDFGPQVPPTKAEVNSNVAGAGNKQYVPFVIAPSSAFPALDGESESAVSPPYTHHLETPNLSKTAEAPLSHSETTSLQDNKSVPPLQTDSVFSSHLNQSEPSSLISPSISPTTQSEPVTTPPSSTFTTSYQNDSAASSFSRTRSEINTDLQDVLAAAMAAAETAERAAVAARAAASLAEVKIADFVTKGKKTTSERSDNEFHSPSSLHQPSALEKPIFDHQDSFRGNIEEIRVMETKLPEFENSPPSAHLPQRLPSIEDDPYFSYPNLFSSKDVDGKSGTGPSSHNT